MKILNFLEAGQLCMKTTYALAPSIVGTRVPTVWSSAHLKNHNAPSVLAEEKSLVSDPYFNSLCPWSVEQERPEITSVVQSTWMVPKTQTMDSKDVQNQKQICFLQARSVCSWKKSSRTPLEITTICLERHLEKSHFSLSHCKTSALQKAASQRKVFGKPHAEEIVRHETLNLDKIFSGKHH